MVFRENIISNSKDVSGKNIKFIDVEQQNNINNE